MMKKTFCGALCVIPLLVLTALFIAVLHHTRAEARQQRRWAVVVGIDCYMYEVTPLHCAVNDAEKFTRVLIQSAGFDKDDVFLLTSTQKGNRLPTKLNVVKWICYIREKASPDDTFLLFFSGHGMDLENESYLITYDADPSTKETLEMSALKVSDLKEIIEELKTKKALFFIDACRDDPRMGKGKENNPLTEMQSKNLSIKPAECSTSDNSGFSLTFFSCRVGQRSYEWSERGMGFFTYYLVEGMNGEAKNAAGNVTISSLKKYLGTKVPQAVERERGTGMSQEPWVRGDASVRAEEWVIGKGSGPISSEPASIEEESTAIVPSSTQTPAETPEKPLLEQAQDAFNAGRYADPPGDNAIDLARQLLANEPDNAWARSLEKRAREEYEKLARSAMEKNDFPRALDLFDRLFALFPNEPEYQEIQVMMNGIGEWTSYASLFIFSGSGKAFVRRDGTCTFLGDGKAPDEGTWTITNLKERIFHCEFRSGMWCDLKMSGDGQKLEGSLHNGAHVIMNKVQSK